ncbi:hypothetical protein Hanom_Chr07g00640731 [Helianthus anomalus]
MVLLVSGQSQLRFSLGHDSRASPGATRLNPVRLGIITLMLIILFRIFVTF